MSDTVTITQAQEKIVSTITAEVERFESEITRALLAARPTERLETIDRSIGVRRGVEKLLALDNPHTPVQDSEVPRGSAKLNRETRERVTLAAFEAAKAQIDAEVEAAEIRPVDDGGYQGSIDDGRISKTGESPDAVRVRLAHSLEAELEDGASVQRFELRGLMLLAAKALDNSEVPQGLGDEDRERLEEQVEGEQAIRAAEFAAGWSAAAGRLGGSIRNEIEFLRDSATAGEGAVAADPSLSISGAAANRRTASRLEAALAEFEEFAPKLADLQQEDSGDLREWLTSDEARAVTARAINPVPFEKSSGMGHQEFAEDDRIDREVALTSADRILAALSRHSTDEGGKG